MTECPQHPLEPPNGWGADGWARWLRCAHLGNRVAASARINKPLSSTPGWEAFTIATEGGDETADESYCLYHPATGLDEQCVDRGHEQSQVVARGGLMKPGRDCTATT